MRNNNIRLEYKTPRASSPKEAQPSFKSSFETVKDIVTLEFNDEIYISEKGVDLLFVLEAKIPVEVAMKLPNHIDEEYPVINFDDAPGDLDEPLLEGLR